MQCIKTVTLPDEVVISGESPRNFQEGTLTLHFQEISVVSCNGCLFCSHLHVVQQFHDGGA